MGRYCWRGRRHEQTRQPEAAMTITSRAPPRTGPVPGISSGRRTRRGGHSPLYHPLAETSTARYPLSEKTIELPPTLEPVALGHASSHSAMRVLPVAAAAAVSVPQTCHTPEASKVSDGSSRAKPPAHQPIRRPCSGQRMVTDLPSWCCGPPRCSIVSAVASVSRPSRCAVASRALTRRPRPEGWQRSRRMGEEQATGDRCKSKPGSPCH